MNMCSSDRYRSGIMRLAPWVIAVILATFTSVPASGAGAAKPNIVIIFTDDQGYADVGKFGAEGFKTPNLDRLAEEGAVFRNFHVAQAVCSASRAALLTECYPNRIGIHGALGPGSKVGLGNDELTLADLLKGQGYATGMFGEWHLGDSSQFMPTRHGFDKYFGLPYSNDMWALRHDTGDVSEADLKLRGNTYPNLPLFENEKGYIPKATRADQDQLTSWYAERAVKFIEQHKSLPFFLYVAHNMPRVPLHVSDKYSLVKIEQAQLYDLTNDVGEANNVAAQHPEIVEQLEAEAEKARAELGDALTKRTGVGNPRPGRLVQAQSSSQP